MDKPGARTAPLSLTYGDGVTELPKTCEGMNVQAMISFRNLGVTLLGVGLLAGCTATGNERRVNADLENAKAEEALLVQRVEDIFLTDGETLQSELPSGDATYTGQIYGFNGGGSGPDLEYVADLTLEVDFDTDGITGTVDNFETDLSGFASPTGSIPVTGAVSNAPGIATLNFGGNGALTGVDRTATYATGASGSFIGDNAEAARGTQLTNFTWQSGPDTGDTSISDGRWTAEQ